MPLNKKRTRQLREARAKRNPSTDGAQHTPAVVASVNQTDGLVSSTSPNEERPLKSIRPHFDFVWNPLNRHQPDGIRVGIVAQQHSSTVTTVVQTVARCLGVDLRQQGDIFVSIAIDRASHSNGEVVLFSQECRQTVESTSDARRCVTSISTTKTKHYCSNLYNILCWAMKVVVVEL
jgi:hypothetical protein